MRKQNLAPKPISIAATSSAGNAAGYVFCDRISGVVRFQVDADATGDLPVERAAGLLAIHCLVRGQTPHDYTVLVAPRETLLDSVAQRARELLESGKTIANEVRLSPREREVLDCVAHNLCNKDIAARLNVCERTIKFHVSALLSKFKVRNRLGLLHEAPRALRSPQHADSIETLFGFSMKAHAFTRQPNPLKKGSQVLPMPRAPQIT